MRFHHGQQLQGGEHFDDAAHTKARADGRVSAQDTEPTQEMIATLMKHIRNQFYADRPLEKWLRDQRMVMGILTWPATWLNQRGVGLPVARYEAILREVIVDIQRHGATGEIKYFPAYFERAVKSWFAHKGEDLYNERKSLRNAIDLRFLKGMKTAPANDGAKLEVLVETHALLATTRRRAKTQNKSDQLDLL